MGKDVFMVVKMPAACLNNVYTIFKAHQTCTFQSVSKVWVNLYQSNNN